MTHASRQLVRGASLAAIAALVLAPPALARDITLEFEDAVFSDPLTIDNQYWPLEEGATFIYKAETADGCEEDHVTVTSRTERILGVRVRVVEDLAYEDPECDGVDDSELVEKTFDWYAQDDAGNIWYFGEDTFDCEGIDNCTKGDGSWKAGVDGAQPGIIMLADPRKGDTYYQEFYADHAEDQATVKGVGVTVTLTRDDAIEPGTFSNCLVTKEFTKLDPGAVEQKYYCPGAGLVAIDEHHGSLVRFELTEPAASTEANDAFRFREVK